MAAWLRRNWRIVALVGAALAFRLAVVASWQAPAGDGLQYYALSQSLIRDGRYAFAPPPAPLQHSRVPGYPLFLAAVVHQAPISLAGHLRRATVANAFLDVATATLVLLLLLRRGHRPLHAWCAFAAVIVCPMILFLSCYGLSESLATFLTTAVVVGAMQEGWAPVIVAGALYGFSQLVRVDALTVLPAAAIGLWHAPSWKRRILRGVAFAGAAMITFAPWPLRNLHQFGAPHAEGTPWVSQDGTPMRLGMMHWMMTWGTGAPGEDYDLMVVANSLPLDTHRPGIVVASMYDDAAERARVVAVFERYNRERFSVGVDHDFEELAAARKRAHPFRQRVILPLRRALQLWTFMPEWELPVRSKLLGLPAARPVYAWFERLLFVMALAGAVLAWRRDRTLVVVALLLAATRTAVIANAHPFPVERYVAESFPMLMALAGIAIGSLARRLADARRRGRAT